MGLAVRLGALNLTVSSWQHPRPLWTPEGSVDPMGSGDAAAGGVAGPALPSHCSGADTPLRAPAPAPAASALTWPPGPHLPRPAPPLAEPHRSGQWDPREGERLPPPSPHYRAKAPVMQHPLSASPLPASPCLHPPCLIPPRLHHRSSRIPGPWGKVAAMRCSVKPRPCQSPLPGPHLPWPVPSPAQPRGAASCRRRWPRCWRSSTESHRAALSRRHARTRDARTRDETRPEMPMLKPRPRHGRGAAPGERMKRSGTGAQGTPGHPRAAWIPQRLRLGAVSPSGELWGEPRGRVRVGAPGRSFLSVTLGTARTGSPGDVGACPG